MLSFNLDWVRVLGLVVSTILPIIVALVTNSKTLGHWKAILLAVLAAVTGFGTEVLQALTNHTAYDVGQGLLSALAAFLVAVAMYFGLWKPTGLTSSGTGLLSGNRDAIPVQESADSFARRHTGDTFITVNSSDPLATKDDVPPHA